MILLSQWRPRMDFVRYREDTHEERQLVFPRGYNKMFHNHKINFQMTMLIWDASNIPDGIPSAQSQSDS
jgi:hypothetical protein